MKPVVVFVLGGPGAGKGTQCARIVAVRAGKGTPTPGSAGLRLLQAVHLDKDFKVLQLSLKE